MTIVTRPSTFKPSKRHKLLNVSTPKKEENKNAPSSPHPVNQNYYFFGFARDRGLEKVCWTLFFIPDKLLLAIHFGELLYKRGHYGWNSSQSTSTNTLVPPYNGGIQAFSTHPSRHGHPTTQSGYGTHDPIPGEQQAHSH